MELDFQGGLKLPTGYARSMIPEGGANRAEPLLQYLHAADVGREP